MSPRSIRRKLAVPIKSPPVFYPAAILPLIIEQDSVSIKETGEVKADILRFHLRF